MKGLLFFYYGGAKLSRQIYITENDRAKLKKLIDDALFDGKADKSFEDLRNEMKNAKTVNIKDLPGNVVTMNSKVLILLDGNEEEITLVYPQEADLIENRISVLSPIGIALLGYSEGDTIQWTVPSGMMEIEIRKVLYQPEAAGDLHL